MLISKEESEQMLEAAKPLMKWLSENSHPHCRAIVDSTAVELVEAVARSGTEEYLKY